VCIMIYDGMYMKIKRNRFLNPFYVSKEEIELNDNEENYV